MIAHVAVPFATALASFAAMAWLGRSTSQPHVLALDTAAQRVFYGRAVRLASFFTLSGYARTLGAQMIGVVLVARIAGHEVLAIVALALWQMAGQGVVNHVLKPLFARARPTEWAFRHELTKAYPSGHSATAVVFYGGLALLLPHALRLESPGAWLLASVFVLWALGIAWSRLALGAHYASDVAGGLLFGFGWLSLGYTLAFAARIAV